MSFLFSSIKKHAVGMTALFFLITSLVAMIALLFHSPVFEAGARIHIPEIMTGGSAEQESGEGGSSSSPEKPPVLNNVGLQTAVEILRGNVLAEQTMTTIGITDLYPDLVRNGKEKEQFLSRALAAFQQHLSVAALQDTRIIHITFQHPKAEISTRVVKIMLRLFQEEWKKLQSPHDTWKNEQLHLSNQEMYRRARALSMFQQSIQLLEKKRKKTQEQYERTERLLAAAQKNSQEQLKRLNSLEEQFAGRLIPDKAAGEQKEQEKFSEERKDVIRLKLYEKNLREKYGQGSRGDRLINNVRLQIASLEDKLYTEAGIAETEHKEVQAAAEEIVLVRIAYSRQQEKTDRLQRQVRQMQNTLQRLAEQDAVRAELRREAEAARERYINLVEQLKTEQKLRERSEQTVLIEKPVLPLRPITANKVPALLLAVTSGLVGSIVYGMRELF